MKKVVYYLAALVMVAGFVACSGNKADMVAAKWKVADMDMGKPVPPDQKAMMDKMMEEVKKNSFFDFHKDGTYELSMMGQGEKGTWKLSDDGTKLLCKTEGKDKEQALNMTEISSSKMVLEMEDHGEKMKFTLGK